MERSQNIMCSHFLGTGKNERLLTGLSVGNADIIYSNIQRGTVDQMGGDKNINDCFPDLRCRDTTSSNHIVNQ